MLVLDATTGQNAVSQAKLFSEAADITGIILTKLDGTAKGGIVISIAKEQNVPVNLSASVKVSTTYRNLTAMILQRLYLKNK